MTRPLSMMPLLRSYASRVRAWPWALLALLLVALPARAADDAGTQSVFAGGAGNRALGMGGAFVAAADDASAMMWNPAGLGIVSRFQVEAAQSGDLGLGMTDAYAAVAWPDWRWGAIGMTLRHFGVGGIERRDDRNVLLADDLGDSEFEAAIGYGRELGDIWAVGGSVKLQHQSLAGFSGSGLGLDLGFSARPAPLLHLDSPWADGLTWGVAIRNLVEPAIRLDRESVPDPAQLRTGLAWRTLLPTGGGLLAELDLTRSAGVSSHMHAGLEYRIHPAAALRIGMNGSTLTAGTGLRWRDVQFDYAFENGAIAPAHRAGVTLQFGGTKEDQRRAFNEREDAKADERLAEGFRRRQAEQIAGLLARAGAAREKGDVDGALESLALVATLDPGNPEAAHLERACLGDRATGFERSGDYSSASLAWSRVLTSAPGDTAASAGLQRCRDASDRAAQRSAEVRALFGKAMDAFAAGDLAAARAGFVAVLAAEPGDAEAARMLDRTDQAIGRRAELARQKAAEDAARAARPVARVDSSRVAPAAPARPQLSDRDAEDLYQHGLAAMRAGRNDDALRWWELLASSRPDYREVTMLLKREYLTRGMESFAAGRLDEAIAQWKLVLKLDPNDARALGYLDRAEKARVHSREILGANP